MPNFFILFSYSLVLVMAEARLTTLALAARLNAEPESEIVQFFKKSGACSLEQAKAALALSRELEERVRSSSQLVFTIGTLFQIVQQYISEKEGEKLREEQEWAALANSPETNFPRSRFVPSSSSSSSMPPPAAVAEDEEEVRLGIVASQLAAGEFLVKAKIDLRARDSVKEHDLTHGQIFVIDQVRGLGDGSSDAWFCGYALEDAEQMHKWIYSQYVVKIFH